MTEEEVNRCQIQEWYPKFKSISIKTRFHELPESFVQYLLDNTGPLLLPLSISNDDALPNRIRNPEDEEDYVVSEGSDDESERPAPPPSFPDLELQIKESIESLGGSVFPKLNWSSPKDSAWISSTGDLRCTSFSEIALLLKSSDSLVHDLCHAYDLCTAKTMSRPSRFVLALRKWYALQPEMEFRCFVQNRLLVGISQREVTVFYPVLAEMKDDLESIIHNFFMEKVRLKFESENYTFDIYVTKDGKVKLLDFNLWGGSTLSLLFDWEELEKESEEKTVVELRIVESRLGVRPGLKTAVPYDYLDTSEGSGWDQFMKKAEEERQQQNMTSDADAGAAATGNLQLTPSSNYQRPLESSSSCTPQNVKLFDSGKVSLQSQQGGNQNESQRQSTNNFNGRRPRKRAKTSTKLEEKMLAALELIIENNDGPSYDDCVEKLNDIGWDKCSDLYIVALGIFCESPSYRKGWMLLPSENIKLITAWVTSFGQRLGFHI